jgi:hypothetical protein
MDSSKEEDQSDCCPLSDLENNIPVQPSQSPLAADHNIVVFHGPDDLENPHNWTKGRKVAITFLLTLIAFGPTFASSVFSSGNEQVSEQLHISKEVTVLGTSMFLLVCVKGYYTEPLQLQNDGDNDI